LDVKILRYEGVKMKKLTNINFFGSPGSGKSTLSAGLFYEMKKKNYKAELVTEYAKSLVYSESFLKLQDQLMVLANQHHPLFALEGKVDFAINDGPFILGIIYLNSELYPKKEFNDFVMTLWKQHNHINYFIKRTESLEYQNFGRIQNEKESKELEDKIQALLDMNKIPYKILETGNENNLDIVLEDVMKYYKNKIYEKGK
jgi:hypothetical protein